MVECEHAKEANGLHCNEHRDPCGNLCPRVGDAWTPIWRGTGAVHHHFYRWPDERDFCLGDSLPAKGTRGGAERGQNCAMVLQEKAPFGPYHIDDIVAHVSHHDMGDHSSILKSNLPNAHAGQHKWKQSKVLLGTRPHTHFIYPEHFAERRHSSVISSFS